MKLIRTLLATACVWLTASAFAAASNSTPDAPNNAPNDAPTLKTLRYAFLIAETTFDPAQVTDLYSRTVIAGIMEAPLEFEFMAKPVRMKPNTAVALPVVSADFKTITFRIKPGIYFADDPAFKGPDGRQLRRELVAEDYVYSIKRHYDPRWKSGNLYLLENAQILGLSELRKKLMAEKKPFDYDTPVEGVRALDRYTLQIKLGVPAPRFTLQFADAAFLGALAREVVEFYGDKVGEHPVGTGPYRLAQWKRSSKIVLERNPGFREVLYDEHPPENDARLQAIAKAFKGKRLPLTERVEIAIIEEPQPRWLSFLNEEQDLMDQLPHDFAGVVIPNDKLAPNLVKKGIQMVRYSRADVSMSYFGMENKVVGGYTPDKVALRRAISLAVDVEREINLVRRGQAIPAQGIVAPGVTGYDPAFKSEMSDFSRARARALLDMHGYVDKDGDGWRDQPDGKPLVLEYSTQPDQLSRQSQELWRKAMGKIAVRMEFKIAKWPEQLKASRAGKLMMWGVAWSATSPDGLYFLDLLYGPNKGQANHARFDLPEFNALHQRAAVMPDGPEREAVMAQAKALSVAYMPYKVIAHRIATDLMHPHVQGYKRHPFMRDWWRYVDVEMAPARP